MTTAVIEIPVAPSSLGEGTVLDLIRRSREHGSHVSSVSDHVEFRFNNSDQAERFLNWIRTRYGDLVPARLITLRALNIQLFDKVSQLIQQGQLVRYELVPLYQRFTEGTGNSIITLFDGQRRSYNVLARHDTNTGMIYPPQ